MCVFYLVKTELFLRVKLHLESYLSWGVICRKKLRSLTPIRHAMKVTTIAVSSRVEAEKEGTSEHVQMAI